MNNDISRNIIDNTDIKLIPGEPDACPENGEHGSECCCDECDCYLLCFPEFDESSKD